MQDMPIPWRLIVQIQSFELYLLQDASEGILTANAQRPGGVEPSRTPAGENTAKLRQKCTGWTRTMKGPKTHLGTVDVALLTTAVESRTKSRGDWSLARWGDAKRSRCGNGQPVTVPDLSRNCVERLGLLSNQLLMAHWVC